MFKFSKTVGICGAIILIALDIWTLFGCFGLKDAALFNQILNNMLPCNAILGLFAFCVLQNKSAKKALGISGTVVFGATAIIRLAATIFYIVESVNVLILYEAPVTIDWLCNVLRFFAYVPLFISAIFLVVCVLCRKMKKTTQLLGGISIFILIFSWIVNVYLLVSSGISNEYGFFEIYINIFNAGLIRDIVFACGYTLIVSSLTGEMEKRKA